MKIYPDLYEPLIFNLEQDEDYRTTKKVRITVRRRKEKAAQRRRTN